MEEFLKLNWRIKDVSALTSNEFLSDENIADSYVFQKLEPVEKLQRDTEYVPGEKVFAPIQKWSTLNSTQHKQCLRALQLMMNNRQRSNTLDISVMEIYNSFRQQILDENKLFYEVVKKAWSTRKRQKNVPRRYEDNAKEIWMRSFSAIKKYPEYFKYLDMLSIAHSSDQSEAEMTWKHHIFNLGRVAKYIGPSFSSRCTLGAGSLSDEQSDNLYFKCTVSEDRNIDQMLLKFPVSVVMSSSSLKRLLEINTCTDWDLPVIIREFNNRKVIFFDKPLHSVEPSRNRVIQKIYKDHMRLKFCGTTAQQYESKGYTIVEEDIKVQGEDSAVEKPEIHHNVSYNLWTLNLKTEVKELIKGYKPNREFLVLVRTKLDALEVLDNGVHQQVIVVPKLEHQLQYGANVCTKHELSRQWCSLFFRPSSCLYRLRTHTQSAEVIMSEPCNLQKINSEAHSLYNYQPSSGFQALYRLTSELNKLGVGNYLLHHKKTDENFVSLLQATSEPGGNVYEFHNAYDHNKFEIQAAEEPWLPIDTNLVLPIHAKLGLLPGMFARFVSVHQKRPKSKPKKKKPAKKQKTT